MTRILCLYTGGTIGCRPTAQGLAPAHGLLEAPLRALAQSLALELDWLEYPQLLDSSSMGPADWNRIGQDIFERYAQHDGFVVLHGTDTLAYTAAALSLQFEHLGKPLLVTGAQRPWLSPDSDAPANVTLALHAAADGYPGVRVAFGGRLLPGQAVRKLDTEADQAFDAPLWDGRWPAAATAGPVRFTPVDPTQRVIGLKLYPGASTDWLAAALREPVDGLVLETYGSGNLPEHPPLLAALQRQAAQGAWIINCSQCLKGPVHPGRYATGATLARLGAEASGDMTPEAALVSLYVRLARARV